MKNFDFKNFDYTKVVKIIEKGLLFLVGSWIVGYLCLMLGSNFGNILSGAPIDPELGLVFDPITLVVGICIVAFIIIVFFGKSIFKNGNIFSGGKNADSYKRIRGNSYGMWIATEINLHADSFIREAFNRQLAARDRRVLWDLNPSPPAHPIYRDYLDQFEGMEAAGSVRPGYYNYGHFTIFDNPSVSPERIAEITAQYDKTSVWYRRDILGERCAAEGLIYRSFADNPEAFMLDEINERDLKFVNIGVDFGGNRSKTTFVAVGFTVSGAIVALREAEVGGEKGVIVMRMDEGSSCVSFTPLVTVEEFERRRAFNEGKEKGEIDAPRINGEMRRFISSLRADFPTTPIRYLFADSEAQYLVNGLRRTLADSGIQLIDISRVFPLFHLDPDDERNYDFAATDELLKRCRATGSEIEYRLGESIEHSPKQFKVHPPKDYAKWAEICVHIIRHYNEGWANGYRWNIRRWSVWEEPDNPPVLFTGDYRKDFLPLYATTAKRIKKDFPNLLVGGPAAADWRASLVLAEYCAKNGVPLDFLEWDEYERDPDKLLQDARAVRARLDELGLKKTENVIAEWHFGPDGWDRFSYPELGKSNQDDLTSVESAAYAAAVLQLFQDGPADQMFYYTGGCGIWGIYDAYRQKRLAWYVFRAFADVARRCTRAFGP